MFFWEVLLEVVEVECSLVGDLFIIIFGVVGK